MLHEEEFAVYFDEEVGEWVARHTTYSIVGVGNSDTEALEEAIGNLKFYLGFEEQSQAEELLEKALEDSPFLSMTLRKADCDEFVVGVDYDHTQLYEINKYGIRIAGGGAFIPRDVVKAIMEFQDAYYGKEYDYEEME